MKVFLEGSEAPLDFDSIIVTCKLDVNETKFLAFTEEEKGL